MRVEWVEVECGEASYVARDKGQGTRDKVEGRGQDREGGEGGVGWSVGCEHPAVLHSFGIYYCPASYCTAHSVYWRL